MSTAPFKQVEQHPKYHISGGDLHILVGNIQFRVHSYFFERDSDKFREIFNTPAPPNAPRPGSSDSSPIVIERAGPAEFSLLLWVFYNEKYSLYEATSSQWITILKLACEYRFHEVKLLAIRELEMGNLTTVQLIRVYELYKVDRSYLVPLYAILCKREECPTDEETDELGMKTSLLIFRLRETLRSQLGVGSKSPLPADLDEEDVTRAICSSLGVTQNALRRKRPITLTRTSTLDFPRRMTRSPEAPRHSLDRQTNRQALDLDQYVCLGPGGCRYLPAATSKDCIFDQKIAGGSENGKEDIIVVDKALISGHHHSPTYAIIAHSDGHFIRIFLMMPLPGRMIPYVLHVLFGLALTSISMNLVSLRRSTEEEKYRINAQLSILDSIKQQLQSKEPLSTDELDRLKRLALSSKTKDEGVDGAEASVGSSTDVSWSAIFRGKAPVVSEEISKWDKQDLETIRKELSK